MSKLDNKSEKQLKQEYELYELGFKAAMLFIEKFVEHGQEPDFYQKSKQPAESILMGGKMTLLVTSGIMKLHFNDEESESSSESESDEETDPVVAGLVQHLQKQHPNANVTVIKCPVPKSE